MTNSTRAVVSPAGVAARAALAAAVCIAGLNAGCASGRGRGSDAPMVDRAEALRRAVALASEGQQAHNAEKYDDAVRLYKESLSINPEIGGVWNNLGVSLMARAGELDFIEASQAFKRAADLMPTDPTPYQNMGVLYEQRGYGEEALRYFDLSLQRDPNWLPSLRGSVRAGKQLLRADQPSLDRVNRALMVEADPAWRQVFEFERIRIQNTMTEQEAAARREDRLRRTR